MVAKRPFIRRLFLTSLCCLALAGFPNLAKADKPYFVTYDAEMEEPGNLEIAFNPVPDGMTLKIEPTFGLNHNSARTLVRFGVSYEIPRFDRLIRKWFR